MSHRGGEIQKADPNARSCTEKVLAPTVARLNGGREKRPVTDTGSRKTRSRNLAAASPCRVLDT